MSTDHTTDPADDVTTDRSARLRNALRGRRTRALLAGGVILGLGATATLAAYSDSEWVTSAFSAAAVEPELVLEIEASRDGTEWAEDEVTLQFTADATRMTAGTTYYAPLYLRLKDTTSLPDGTYAVVTLSGATLAPESSMELASRVNVDLVETATATCALGTTGTSLWSGFMNATNPSAGFRIYPGASGQPSATSNLCAKFTLTQRPADTAPHTATATWTVNATLGGV